MQRTRASVQNGSSISELQTASAENDESNDVKVNDIMVDWNTTILKIMTKH